MFASHFIKIYCGFSLIIAIKMIIVLAQHQSTEKQPQVTPYYVEPINVGAKRDWNDYVQMLIEFKRDGPGEHGAPIAIADPTDKAIADQKALEYGYNIVISDTISVNRSLRDLRFDSCYSKLYLAKLPTVTVVIPFYNEYKSVLARTLHSIVNRSPPELLKEIIMVDDGSTIEQLKDEWEQYVKQNFKRLVRIVRLKHRRGLIGARLAGARRATANVLIFFDSHIECSYNWLPPLLEPIAMNSKIATCPIIDVIKHDTFEYQYAINFTARGIFDWNMEYRIIPSNIDASDLTKSKPYNNPVMMGGLFAIDRKFFWELGGYDDNLDIWGAEQYELSFKIWMCGGMVLDIPCSRVGHIYRGPRTPRPNPRNYNFLARNFKRVAEVWMDSYKDVVYSRNPTEYEKTDAGDLTKQKAMRERLKCNNFQWFLNVIAPEVLTHFPIQKPPSMAYGAVENLAIPLCLDNLNLLLFQPVGLYPCANNKTHPHPNQFWLYTNQNELRQDGRLNICLDVTDTIPNARVFMWPCHGSGGNQHWYYDKEAKWLIHNANGQRCLEALAGEASIVVVNSCDKRNARMKWLFGALNTTSN